MHLGNFEATPRLQEILVKVGDLKLSERLEFDLPEDIDHYFFVAKLGDSPRSWEVGGLYNPITRSTIVIRGYGANERWIFSNPQTPLLLPRINADEFTSDDIFFHTHPGNDCYPSQTDLSTPLFIQMIEQADGFNRTITSLIGSRRCLSKTEAKGINFDEQMLKTSGLLDDKILIVKQGLALEPPIWLKNFAISEETKNTLAQEASRFYLLKRTDNTKRHFEKWGTFRQALPGLVEEKHIPKLIEMLMQTTPQYPTSVYLENIGLNRNQAKLVQQMTGVEVTIYE